MHRQFRCLNSVAYESNFVVVNQCVEGTKMRMLRIPGPSNLLIARISNEILTSSGEGAGGGWEGFSDDVITIVSLLK